MKGGIQTAVIYDSQSMSINIKTRSTSINANSCTEIGGRAIVVY